MIEHFFLVFFRQKRGEKNVLRQKRLFLRIEKNKKKSTSMLLQKKKVGTLLLIHVLYLLQGICILDSRVATQHTKYS